VVDLNAPSSFVHHELRRDVAVLAGLLEDPLGVPS